MKNCYFYVFIACISFSFVSNAQKKIVENASFQKTIKFNDEISKENAIALFLKRDGLDTNTTFVSKKETTDESGLIHQRNQQYYKGIKVEFGTLITHSLNGFVKSINAELYNPKSVNSIPTLSAQQGFQKALLDINAQKYLWEDSAQALVMNYSMPTGELVYFPVVKTGQVKLAYMYDVYSIEPLSRIEIYVDAHSGDILYKNPLIKHVTSLTHNDEIVKSKNLIESLATGTAATKYSGSRSIETTFDSGLNMHVLSDNTRGNGIVTYNCERLINTYQNVHFKDNDNNWTTAEHGNAFFDNAALDAHWGAEMTYDFWKNIFNRNGYDDNNAIIRSYVHFQRTAASLSNAFWNGAVMTYGDGINKPFTSIDICGHEIGHAVCTYTANLAYQNQSGAMNEGYSDIWGACIEHFGRTGNFSSTPIAGVWKIGEDVTSGGLRSMVTPNTNGDPDTFQGTNWKVTGDEGTCIPSGTTNDYCGVHSNSGVMNRWFYVLTAGASGTNNAPIADRDTYSVTGIGIVKSSQIAYYAERDYLTPNSTYFDARDVTIEIAKNLYCDVGAEVIAVTNAWFSVNIGPSFVNIANDVALTNIPINSSLSCTTSTTYTPTVFFENGGSSTITSVNISYNIDGGANTNAVWSGSIASCSSGSYQLSINTTGLSKGTHLLNVTTTVAGDGNNSNNTKSSVIFVNTPTNINLINTFESSNDVLVSYDQSGTNSVWQRGTSTKSTLTNDVAGNSKVYATNLSGSYPSGTKSYLVSQCYDLSQTPNPVLKFDMAFDTESDLDILYMQYSTNGGNSWSLLGTSSDPNWYTSNSGCEICVGGEWTGEADITNISNTTNGTKREYSYNLSSFGSGSGTPQSNMIFRFVFQSDSNYELDGVIIDNFVVGTSLATNEQVFDNLKVYPNPVSNQVSISFMSKSDEKTIISIYDVQGRIITKSNYDGSIGTSNYSIDLSSIPTGFYLLKINQGNNEYNTKIIKN